MEIGRRVPGEVRLSMFLSIFIPPWGAVEWGRRSAGGSGSRVDKPIDKDIFSMRF